MFSMQCVSENHLIAIFQSSVADSLKLGTVSRWCIGEWIKEIAHFVQESFVVSQRPVFEILLLLQF